MMASVEVMPAIGYAQESRMVRQPDSLSPWESRGCGGQTQRAAVRAAATTEPGVLRAPAAPHAPHAPRHSWHRTATVL